MCRVCLIYLYSVTVVFKAATGAATGAMSQSLDDPHSKRATRRPLDFKHYTILINNEWRSEYLIQPNIIGGAA